MLREGQRAAVAGERYWRAASMEAGGGSWRWRKAVAPVVAAGGDCEQLAAGEGYGSGKGKARKEGMGITFIFYF